MKFHLLLFSFLLKVIDASAIRPEIPPSTCLQCICQASSNCDIRNLKCPPHSGEESYCGPYQITRGYWEDGNAIGYDFETCANLKACAERVIINYMKKYSRDCNGDGLIDCDDYAAIHSMGADRCGDPSIVDTEYWKVFKDNCPASTNPLIGGGTFEDGNSRRPSSRRPSPSSFPQDPPLMPDTSIYTADGGESDSDDGFDTTETRGRRWRDRRPGNGRPRVRNTSESDYTPISRIPFRPSYAPFTLEPMADDYPTSSPVATTTARRPTRTRTTTSRNSPTTMASRSPARTRGTTITETTVSPSRETPTTRRRRRPGSRTNRRRVATTPRSLPTTTLANSEFFEPEPSTSRPRPRPRTRPSNRTMTTVPVTTARSSVRTTRNRARNNRTNRRPSSQPSQPVTTSIALNSWATDPIREVTLNDADFGNTLNTDTDNQPSPPGITISNERPSTFIPDVNDLEEDPLDPLPPPIPGMNQTITVTDSCLRCLCESSDTCQKKGSCPNKKGPCGPFMLTYGQWNSVGKPKGEFVKCASSYSCSRDVIRKLLIKNAADCNNDVLINCVDFAIAYKSGSESCSGESDNLFNSQYWSNFETCYGFDRR